ncbi:MULTISPECIES: NUDIX hydrolase [Mammaliicoccus]|uniref:NUDIX hydrolase n=1 Tax=Mammaliicoccus TaxID=2803850 RepID=UPI000D1E7EEC|nr:MULTISPECIES: NUDIX hydrolase [Mammaliicoccus]MCE4980652.1 NUDIX hydrolase [Mammaliicoccus sciuri]MCE5085452.1 NUDIX hydrolase [Mammaliicoccus sciuri]MCE5095094.1 NUDIX hydrolase [Mammaliicoccus sciuri]MCJ0967799.1 NUDIX hydrolase [Mammaliicoccus sciuri]MDT0696305.1 NUDIX hydrolase [Mammaliicoccus sciuri]
MDYISSLRDKVGHAPVILVGALVLIFNKDKQLLLQLRSDNESWGLPGGTMELGESFEEAATREVYEETNLEIQNLKFITNFSGKDYHMVYPNGDEAYTVTALFESEEYEGELSADIKETQNLKFFDLDKLPQNISPPVKMKEFILNYLSQK